MAETVTAFGSAWDTPARTVSVLRAQAAAAGVKLASVADVSAVAAAVAAHAWVVCCREESLTAANRQPASVRRSAAAILARAAGALPLMPVEAVSERASAVEPLACPHPLSRRVHEAYMWADTRLPDSEQLAVALANAADDLLLAGSHPAAAAGWLLLGEAEHLLYDR